VGESALFLLDARDALESLRDGSGWEIEYPRDVWRLHKLPGITVPAGRPCPRARLRFDRITQPWLRELAKRWTRLRLACGLSIGAAYSGVDALTCFSQFLTLSASTLSLMSTGSCWNAISPTSPHSPAAPARRRPGSAG
jgi:hypothetical protein